MAGSFLTDDLSAILSVADFAVTATWLEQQTTIDGIFDDGEVEVERGDGQKHLIRATRFKTQVSHGVADDDTLTINSQIFTVAFQQDDGHGLVTLYLEKQ